MTQRELVAEEREIRRQQREDEIQEVQRATDELVSVHHEVFPTAAPPSAPPPQPVDTAAIKEKLSRAAGITELEGKLPGGVEPPVAPEPDPVNRAELVAQFRRDELAEIPLLRLGQRREAKKQADQKAEEAARAEEERQVAARTVAQAELDRLWQELEKSRAKVDKAAEVEAERQRRAREQERQALQQQLDTEWKLFQANDPGVVVAALEAAYADNSAPAAPIDCEEDAVTVTMKFNGPEIVPERRPDWTPGGKPTLKRRKKAEINALYLEALGSNVLATVKEALAVTPSIEEVTILVLREESKGKDAGLLSAVYAGQFIRASRAPDGKWDDLDPVRALEDAPGALLNRKGVAEEVSPLNLTEEHELQEVVDRIADDLGLEPVATKKKRAQSRTKRASKPADLLVGLEKETDSHKRWETLWTLQDRRIDLSLVEPLERIAINDSEPNVRGLALSLLGQIGDPRSAPTLAEAAQDPDSHLRWQAITALNEVGPQGQLDLLATALEDPETNVRQAAIGGLETIGSEEAFRAIAGAIDDSDPMVRWLVTAAISGRTDSASIAALAAAKEDSDPDVREIARM